MGTEKTWYVSRCCNSLRKCLSCSSSASLWSCLDLVGWLAYPDKGDGMRHLSVGCSTQIWTSHSTRSRRSSGDCKRKDLFHRIGEARRERGKDDDHSPLLHGLSHSSGYALEPKWLSLSRSKSGSYDHHRKIFMSFVEELVCDAYALGDDLFFFSFS